MKKKKICCPFCESEEIIPIIYGLPGVELLEAAERGDVELGGCEVYYANEKHFCRECEKKWSHFTLSADQIVKIRYKKWNVGLGLLEWARMHVYEIFPDGRMRHYMYKGTSRKYVSRDLYQLEKCEIESVMKDLFTAVDRYFMDPYYMSVKDGNAYELQITYSDNDKEIIEGSVGEGSEVSRLLEEFISKFENAGIE